MRDIAHFVNGEAAPEASGRHGYVFDPNTGEVQARVALASPEELDAAVRHAAAAQVGWAATNPQRRARGVFEVKRLVQARLDEAAHPLSSPHRKGIADSRGDIQRGLEGGEVACRLPPL